MNATELLHFFARGWRIERSITDHSNRDVYTFTGRTRGLMIERGLLRRAGESWRVRRAYRFRIEGARVRVDFEDGREFYTIGAAGLSRIHHRCGDDLYEGQMQIGPVDWRLSWRVTGPNKDLTIQTRYF